MSDSIVFKEGYFKLNSQPNFNYQLNRLIMWDGGDLEEVSRIANKIINSETWCHELIELGNQAVQKGDFERAAAYYRMSEFFMYHGNPDKMIYYQKAVDIFYSWRNSYFISDEVKRFSVSYENVKLPVLYTRAKGTKTDTILLHGGNDSYMEELFSPMLYLSEQGFDVYLFEGPGQGGVLREQGKIFTYQWEKPVRAICDFFHIEDCTIIGASLGGMLAPRAAAFEQRIKRVVGWSIFPSFLDVTLHSIPIRIRKIVRCMIRHNCRSLLNAFLKKIMRQDETIRWGINHGMYAYGAQTPFDFLKIMDDFQMVNIGSKIKQDFLIIGASQDHFISPELYKEEIDSLTNVRSLTFRLFTEQQNASAHCNVGNTKLVLDTITNWIKTV